jgi:hypothetical protein
MISNISFGFSKIQLSVVNNKKRPHLGSFSIKNAIRRKALLVDQPSNFLRRRSKPINIKPANTARETGAAAASNSGTELTEPVIV